MHVPKDTVKMDEWISDKIDILTAHFLPLIFVVT
jgi:hypothetical protein